MVYSQNPPYEVLSTRLLSFDQLAVLRRVARFWDLIGNSGNFVDTLALLFADQRSAFVQFLHLTEWLFEKVRRMHGISLLRLMELVFEFATSIRHLDEQLVVQAIWKDYMRAGRRDIPPFLQRFNLEQPGRKTTAAQLPGRQKRHLDPTRLHN